MTRFLALVAALALATVPVAHAAAGTRQVDVISDCQHAHYKPSSIILSCADANSFVKRIHYTSYGAQTAKAGARFVYNDCEPNCAAGHFHHFHVQITLKRVRDHYGKALFTRLVTTNHKGQRQTYYLPTKPS